ncbi:MAG: hypothetical protein P8X58_13550 [Syntrophobacterales bacterium]
MGVRCVNLTGPLQEESRRLLPEGKLTFWKDDSHWNRYGMAVAARTIQAFWQKQEVSDENVSLREGTRGRKPLPPPSSSLPQPLKGE